MSTESRAGKEGTRHDSVDPRRIDRNWDELLQEIRVTETGVQIITGFLLTVPFSQRFEELDDFQRTSYLLVLCGSVLTTALIVAPAAFHRILFRHRARPWLVESANRCARAGLMLMALTVSGVLFLAFDVVVDRTTAVVALVATVAVFAALWGVTPLRLLAQRGEVSPRPGQSDDVPWPGSPPST